MIRHNLLYKLLALGVALVLWTYVNAERSPQARRTFTVPIEVRNLPKGYVAEVAAGEVSVTISGLKSVVDGVRKDDVKAWVEIREQPGRASAETRQPVRTRVSGVSETDVTTSVEPAVVKVRVETVSAKRMQVEVKYASSPPVGFAYSESVIIPSGVTVSGRSPDVARVKRVVLTLGEQVPDRAIDDYYPVVALDERGDVVVDVDVEPDRVRLKLQLVEVPATKAVIVSPNVTGEPKHPARVTRVSVVPSSVTLSGRADALMGVSTISTERVSIEGADDTVSRDVALRPPPGVEVDRGSVRITVHISAPEARAQD